MKTKLYLLFLFFMPASLYSQCPLPTAMSNQDGNNVNATILNGGDLFWNGNEGQFIAPADDESPKTSIFASGLWMGGFDPGGTLKLSAQTYGRAGNNFDYSPGPLNDDGTVNEALCTDYDKIWKTTLGDIIAHRADFATDGTIDQPIQSIYAWPGRANPHFESYNGFSLPSLNHGYATFFDVNEDGIYNPEDGDYPHPPNTVSESSPISMNWTIFHDQTLHNQSNGESIRAEVQLTTWSFNCNDNPQVDNTIFTSYKIINRAIEPIDSFYAALFTDFDLGCFQDDYIGSYPAYDAFFSYNSDAVDGEGDNCFGVSAYEGIPPVQSVQFLNRTMDYFTYFNNGAVSPPPPPGTTDPNLPLHYYNYMTGNWEDGTTLIAGGDGYDPASTDFTSHAFIGNPSDPNAWSMYQEGLPISDRRTVASTLVGLLNPGQSTVIDVAYTFHQYDDVNNHLEVIDQMYIDIENIQRLYNNEFFAGCTNFTSVAPSLENKISINPNPSDGIFKVEVENIEVQALQLFDISGRLIHSDQEGFNFSKTLNFGYLNNGIYVLRIKTSEGVLAKKIILSTE